MRKLHVLLTGFILLLAIVSCEKNDKHDFDIDAQKGVKAMKTVVDFGPNIPVSEGEISPEVIPGENNGGNRTCEEVWSWFVDDQVNWECGVDFLCGEKVDYDEDGGGFVSDFPEGLEVSVEGIYISFVMDNCVEIDGKFYKVGAVIVKGSSAANVYYYEGGTMSDQGLAAPGEKHMVSNLTFCFVPCEADELVIAFKSKVKNGDGDSFAAYTTGLSIPNDPGSVRYNVLGFDTPYDIRLQSGEIIASITATELEHNGAPHISVVVTVTDDNTWEFTEPHLYVGTFYGLNHDPDFYLSYKDYPFDIDDVIAAPCEFLIPVSDITW